jgi:repressor LexA
MLSLQADQRQADVLLAIIDAIRRTGRPPTVREIGDAAGISSTSMIHLYLERLVAARKIRRDPSVSRGVWPLVADGCCPMCGGTGKIG